ncbi:MAG: beta-propeller fold lactonase family protein [Clostridia bacterium]|nr:beta-propeller fold lactonase family protein [Clostridia bacterium]
MEKTFYVACWQKEGGVYEMRFDLFSGRFTSVQKAAEGTYTSYFERDGEILYVLSEIPGPRAGLLESFRVTEEGLIPLDRLSGIPGGCPHMRLTRGGKVLAAASYETGDVFTVQADAGRFGGVISLLKHSGHGADPVRQACSHGHMVCETPDGGYLVCVDLGTDEIRVYAMDEAGALTEHSSVQVPAGYGPRHMLFSPDGGYAYVVCELKYRLLTFRYPGSGRFEPVGDLEVIPGLEKGQHAGGAIKLSRDGKALFTTNRGTEESSVDVLSLSDPAHPAWRGALTGLSHPRDILFFSDGDKEYLLCPNLTRSVVTVWAYDPKKSSFTFLDGTDAVPRPGSVTA